MTALTFDPRGLQLARALESVDDAIMLLEWRYEREAEPTVAKLRILREELRLAETLLASGDRLH
jgi:hypothetical protein